MGIDLLFHPKESGQSYYLEMHKISKSVGFNKDVPQFTFQTFLLTRLLWIVCEANLATYCGTDESLAELKVKFTL